MTLKKSGNYSDGEEICDCQWLEVGGGSACNRVARGTVLGDGTLLCPYRRGSSTHLYLCSSSWNCSHQKTSYYMTAILILYFKERIY